MYQQNPYQQQGLGGQQSSPSQQSYLQEQDLANLVLSELKRMAREYTTAVLEANNPQTRQTFEFLLQKTMHDQSMLYQVIQQTHGYGDIPIATQQEIQKELQQQSQSSPKLHDFVHQNQIGSLGGQQMTQQSSQQGAQQMMQQGIQQGIQQGAQLYSQQMGQPNQPQSQSPLFPNGIYGQAPINYTGPQAPSSTYTTTSQSYGQNQGSGMEMSGGVSSASAAPTGTAQGTGGTGASFGTAQASLNQGQGTHSSAASANNPISGYYTSSDTSTGTPKSWHQSSSHNETGAHKISGRIATLNRHEGSKYSF